MAFPSIRAVSSGQTNTSGSSVSCTHPTGLTVGDLMVLFVHIYHNSQNRTITTPSGWALQNSVSGAADLRDLGKVLSCFTKVATAGDVSAGSTTVSFSGAPQDNSWGMYAISGTAVGHEVADSEGDYEQETSVTTGSTSYSNSFTTDITTVSLESLVIGCFATTIFNIADTPALGTSTMVLTPSATITADINISMTDAGSGATGHWTYMGSAQYANDINITNRQITVVSNANISSNTLETASIIIAINAPASPTADVGRLDATPTLHGVTGSNTATADVSHLEIEPELHSVAGKSSSQATQWTNETKPSTTWTNEQK